MMNDRQIDALRPRIAAEAWTMLDHPGSRPRPFADRPILWLDGVELLDASGATTRVDECLDNPAWCRMVAYRVVEVPGA